MSSFLDTNVVVYAYDRAHPAKRQRALELLASEERMVVSTQVLLECWCVLTRKLHVRMSEEDAAGVVADLSLLPVVTADRDLVASGIETARRWRLSVWDAMIVEAARRAGCTRVLSEDLQHGQDLDGIAVENPFRNA